MNFCDCKEDGYCPRYNRDMTGRFREICRGDNVDLGTAAAFREQWANEVKPSTLGHNPLEGKPTHLLLRNSQAVGDAIVMTAAIYSLHVAHPGKFLTAVDTPYPEVFEHNPHVVPVSSLSNAKILQMHYPAIHHSNHRGIHFMQGWCEHLAASLGIPVPLATNRPRLYFDTPDPVVCDYWLVCSGGKKDFTTKLWGHHNYQQVIHSLKGEVGFVQVGSAKHDHPRIEKVRSSLVGETTIRQLFDLCRRAKGVLCGVSMLMHVAAALEKPAVIIAGGREPVQWNSYPKQHYVHTVGALPCSSLQGEVGGACWRSRVVALGDGTQHDKELCERPDDGLPTCMRKIKPDEIAALILRYNASVK